MDILWLTTKVDIESKSGDIIPSGSTGRVFDIIIDNGKPLFQLGFENTITNTITEWVSPEQLEDCDNATTNTDLTSVEKRYMRMMDNIFYSNSIAVAEKAKRVEEKICEIKSELGDDFFYQYDEKDNYKIITNGKDYIAIREKNNNGMYYKRCFKIDIDYYKHYGKLADQNDEKKEICVAEVVLEISGIMYGSYENIGFVIGDKMVFYRV